MFVVKIACLHCWSEVILSFDFQANLPYALVRFWNHEYDFRPNYTPKIYFFIVSIITATKETAFLHAISSAAITHEITLQCARNRIPGCRCGKTKSRKREEADWQWGGCSDNIKYGEKETRRFIDKLEKGNDARTAFNLHNNHVGRKVGW